MTAPVVVIGTAVILTAALLTARALVTALSRGVGRTELDLGELDGATAAYYARKRDALARIHATGKDAS